MSATFTKPDRHQKKTGYSLIETLFSVALMAVITIGIMTAQGGHVRTVDNSKKRTVCTTLAEQRLERLLGIGFDDLLNMASPSVEDYGEIDNFPEYKRTITIDQISEDLVTIQVEVCWQEAEDAGTPSVLKLLRTRPPEKGL